MDRDAREKQSYDEASVWGHSHSWHKRFGHVFECPNTLRNERRFNDHLREKALGRRVLEIGSGDGYTAERILRNGADSVLGIDISRKLVAEAASRAPAGEKIEFRCQSVSLPIEGSFDVIVGRSILHHIDFKEVLTRLHRDNLRPGGSMIFMEPLGSNVLLRLYRLVARSAHTPDERPFYRADLIWFRRTFSGVQVIPYNLCSFIGGLVSTRLFPSADNPLLRFCDQVDEWLARHARSLHPQFRQFVLIIPK